MVWPNRNLITPKSVEKIKKNIFRKNCRSEENGSDYEQISLSLFSSLQQYCNKPLDSKTPHADVNLTVNKRCLITFKKVNETSLLRRFQAILKSVHINSEENGCEQYSSFHFISHFPLSLRTLDLLTRAHTLSLSSLSPTHYIL